MVSSTRRRRLGVLSTPIVLLLSLTAVPAKEASPYDAWIDDEVEWIITKDESKAWKGLKTDEERDRFMALFWARRDPSPGTRRNEFREEYERRLAHVDREYSTSREKGRKSDRGRVYCLLGAPTREGTFQLRSQGGASRGEEPGAAEGPGSIGGTMRGSLPPILWTYEKLPNGFSIPSVEVRFVDYEGFGAYSLDAGGAAAAALKKAVDLFITQPDLTQAPELPADEPVPPVAAAPAPSAEPEAPELPAPLGIKNPDVLALLAKPNPGQGAALQVAMQVATFVGSDGAPFVPVALGPLGAARPADPVYFLRVRRGAEAVQDAEIAAPAPALHTFRLPPGDYEIQAGVLDRATRKHAYVKRALSVKVPAPGALGLSAAVLGRGTETLGAPAPETDAFTFGQVRVIPVLDGVFGKGDELTVFLEVYGIAEDSSGKGRVAATFAFDKSGKFWNEIPEAEQQAVRLSPGRYLLTQILPLSRFSPAPYKLRITVKDVATGKTATSLSEFQVK